jgi:hypothetical protein
LASAEHPNATTVRRLAAMVYDLFLIVAMWMLTTTAIVANVADDAAITYRLAFQGVLLLELFLFYGYFWTMKGTQLAAGWRQIFSWLSNAILWLCLDVSRSRPTDTLRPLFKFASCLHG